MKQNFFLGVLVLVLVGLSSNQNTTEPIQIKAGQQTTHSLTRQESHRGIYQLGIDEDDMPENNPSNWFLFVMTEPVEGSAGTPSKILIQTKGISDETKVIKQCTIEQDSDACFLKDREFDYRKQKVLISVFCPENCQFNLMAQVDVSYPLHVNQILELDFEDTAYTKFFTLNIKNYQYDEVRVILKPKAFLNYPEPIILLANFGYELPTHDKHDFKGLHLWDDGQGIFINKMDMKQSVLTILIEGPERNILQLSNELKIQEQVHNLTKNDPYFDYMKKNQIRTYGILLKSDRPDVPFYMKVTTFTGKIHSHKLYKVNSDGSRLEVPLSNPVEKYGQIEIRLSPEYIRKHMLNYIQIELDGKKESTYLIEYYPQNSKISLLRPLISKSSFMEQNQTDQYAIHVRQLIEKDKNVSSVVVLLQNIEGEVETEFFSCKFNEFEKCYITSEPEKSRQKIKPNRVSTTQKTAKYWFDIPLKSFKKDSQGKDITVFRMVAVVKNTGKGTATYQIQYKNKARIHLLKEGDTNYDRIDIKEKRFYTFSNMDKNIYEIRVHLSMISGLVQFVGSYDDPRNHNSFEPILPIHKILYFKNEISSLNNIYVQVEGIQNAYYSMSVQVMRTTENSTDKNSTEGFNEMIIRQNIPYELIIAPKENMILQLNPSSKSFIMRMITNLPLDICLTQKLQLPPFPPNCQIIVKDIKNQILQIKMMQNKSANLGITNKNNRSVTLDIVYSSSQIVCYEAKLGRTMEKEVFEGGKDFQGYSSHCLFYTLNRYDDLEVTIRFSNHQYFNNSISLRLSHEIIKMTSPVYRFQKHEVQAACQKKDDEDTRHVCHLQIFIENISNTVIDVVAQYVDADIKLLDGIAHETHSLIKKNEPRKFLYWLVNPTNTSVFLESIHGRYKVYGLFANHSRYLNILKNEKLGHYSFPSAEDNHFVSENPFYQLEQVYDISEQSVKKNCIHGGKRDCFLLLSVYLDGENEIQTDGRFRIEVTQESRRLKQNEPVASYLEKGSVQFYQFKNVDENGTIIIEVSNENKRCLDIYVNQGNIRATSSTFDAKGKSSNLLVIKNSKKKNYGITVQANQNCPFIIEISSNPISIATIRKGKFSDFQLWKNEQYYLLFENLIDENFKVLSVHKSGEVLISVKTISRENLESELKKNVSEMKNWLWKGKDQVRIDHLDKNGNPAKNYCSDCFYLIKIEAQRQTEASILIPTPDVEIPISTNLIIKDLLLKKEKVIYRIFTDSKGEFQIYPQYGKLNLTIVDSESNETMFTNIYEAKKEPIVENFHLKNDETYEYSRFSRVIIEAKEDTLFSFSINNQEDYQEEGDYLQYGIPSYLFMKKNSQKCVNGIIEKSGQTFLISFSDTESQLGKQIKVDLKIDKKPLKIEKQTAINEILLTIPKGQISSQSAEYEMCLRSPIDMVLTVVQSSPIIYFPENQAMLVKGEVNLTFGSDGRNILELNECNGRAITSISSEFNSLGALTSEISQARRTNNIIEFYYYGPLFINVKMEKGTISWRKYDGSLNVGTGYDQFQAGWLRVNKNKKNNTITAMAEPLIQIQKSKTYNEIEKITYRFYAGKEEADLYSSMNCNQGQNPRKQYTVTELSKFKLQPQVAFDIQQDLKSFKKYSYFLIGMKAEVKMRNPQGSLESYRFFYPYQQVLNSMLEDKQVTPKPPIISEQIEYDTIFLWTISIALAVLAFFCLCRFMKRKKSRKNDENATLEMKESEWGSSHD